MSVLGNANISSFQGIIYMSFAFSFLLVLLLLQCIAEPGSKADNIDLKFWIESVSLLLLSLLFPMISSLRPVCMFGCPHCASAICLQNISLTEATVVEIISDPNACNA